MPKRNRSTTQAVIDRRIKEGRGTGTGKDYKPWLYIQDVPSTGQENRKTSWTTGREHHLMSLLELDYLFTFDWFPHVIDIREQYPLLPLEDTLAIAEELGIKHPADPETKEITVLSTDLVLTIADGYGGFERAVAVKQASELQDARVIQKLEIERLYWKSCNVEWCIGTERDLNKVLVENVKLIHDYREIPPSAISPSELSDIIVLLTDLVQKPLALTKLAATCDRKLGLDRGTALSVAYHLIATRYWNINMYAPIQPGKPLVFAPPLVQEDIDQNRQASRQ